MIVLVTYICQVRCMRIVENEKHSMCLRQFIHGGLHLVQEQIFARYEGQFRATEK